jgi:nicotinate-nucleotide adenylyltransferase
MQRHIGIYSGTFDPVHPGHVAFACETRDKLQLDEIIFLPELTPRGKPQVTSMQHRQALLEQLLADQPGMRAVQLRSPQFTVDDTLPELHALLGDAQLTMLIGSDIVRTFPYRWEGLQTLLSSVSLAIGMRTGDSHSEITQIITDLQHAYGRPVQYQYIHTPEADMASTQIRSGTINTERLQPSALSYIRENRLYA